MNMSEYKVIVFVIAAALSATAPASAQMQDSTSTANPAASHAGTQSPGNSGSRVNAPSLRAAVTTATHEDTRSMERLKEAAQRLRETIQTLATAPVGEKRNEAMDTARHALLETQQAMIDLPPGLRTRSGPMSEAEYATAMDRLKEAAQRLRDSAHAMATQPAGQRRNEAINQVNAALLEVNEGMVELPWQPGIATTRTGATSGKTASGKTANTTRANAADSSQSFDAMDRNHDGVISRGEFDSH